MDDVGAEDRVAYLPIVDRPAVTLPGGARVAVALSFDSDHETTTLRFGETSPGKLSQGEYGARVAIPRILDLLARNNIPATFFVPAVTALLYPDEQRRIIAEGHEIGMHGWIHENNSLLDEATERDLMLRTREDRIEVRRTIERGRGLGVGDPLWRLDLAVDAPAWLVDEGSTLLVREETQVVHVELR